MRDEGSRRPQTGRPTNNKKREKDMNQHIIKKTAIDLEVVEREIQLRLSREKIKLLISHFLCFILATAVIFFVL